MFLWRIFMNIIESIKSIFNPQNSIPPSNPSETETQIINIQNTNSNKYALLVGINKYEQSGNDLNGCVNDVEAMYKLLITQYGFKPDNIRMLINERATKQAILERLDWLTGIAKPGDLLVWHNSSHGSQIRDRNGDELYDHQDEILITYDHDWENPLIDDDIAEIFKNIPNGAFLTFISDSCFSGSVDRVFNESPTKIRYVHPPLDIAIRSYDRILPINKFGWKSLNRSINDITYIENQRHMLLSGCRDNQTSADATFNGKWHGALTYALLNSLQNNSNLSWKDIHKQIIIKLKTDGFTQVPQLSGPSKLLDSIPFNNIKI